MIEVKRVSSPDGLVDAFVSRFPDDVTFSEVYVQAHNRSFWSRDELVWEANRAYNVDVKWLGNRTLRIKASDAQVVGQQRNISLNELGRKTILVKIVTTIKHPLDIPIYADVPEDDNTSIRFANREKSLEAVIVKLPGVAKESLNAEVYLVSANQKITTEKPVFVGHNVKGLTVGWEDQYYLSVSADSGIVKGFIGRYSVEKGPLRIRCVTVIAQISNPLGEWMRPPCAL